MDDSKACRSMTCKLITETYQSYNVCCHQANDGEEALHMVQQNMKKNQLESKETATETDDYNFNNDNHKFKYMSKVNTKTLINCINCQENNMYDIIFMDYQMPVMNGPTSIKEIRALGFQGKIIGLTGSSMSKDVEIMHNAGADNVLLKPVNDLSLETIIREVYNSK